MGQVFPLCSARKGVDVACMYCILQIFVMLGCPTQTRVKLSFLQIRLDKGRRSRGGQFSRWSAWTSVPKRSEQRWGAACRAFQLRNQNSNVSVFIFLPFIHSPWPLSSALRTTCQKITNPRMTAAIVHSY